MRKLIILLALGIPLTAASVTYTVTSGDRGFTLVTPDFLPSLGISGPTYIGSLVGQVTRNECGAIPGLLNCGNVILSLDSGYATAESRVYGDSFDYFVFEAFFTGVDLAHTGQWTDSQNRTTLTITQAPDVRADLVSSPEPSSFLLLGLGLVGVERARRLLHRAIDPEVVIGSSR